MSLKKSIIIITTAFLLFGSNVSAKTEKECFEKFSRGVYKFNKVFDKAVLEPIAALSNTLLNL